MADDQYKPHASRDDAAEARYHRNAFVVMMALFIVAPAVVYPVFVMKALCFALFACAFNLLLGFGGLLSFGHAMFLGMAGYVVGPRGEGLGPAAGTRDPRRARPRPPCSACSRGCSPSAARASTSR